MGCGEFLVKYILFFTNLFFALAGLALLGLGVAVQIQGTAVINIADSTYQVAPIASMVVGGVVFLIAFFGCCGAIRESNCMLITYSLFMIILMILKITLASLIFVNLDKLVAGVPQVLNEAFNRDRIAFQEIEKAFTCCGPTGPLSYMNIALPETCCATQPCTPLNAYRGCDEQVQGLLETFGLAIGVVCIVVVAIELVAVVFGLCLANHARNKNRRSHY
ncbi:PREDICTED: leukocyte surface antigen CD53-like isoform X1 [Papilio polytes]|uniref:leukocyte surface antigen CD53-like isoform X1 n=1 Tax=Papilio polytes TaxID=76194 RepID=UPI0006768530|nr:PREDICTED: leukocyte surface antigen CD53-like isoform X1 [Papilio polytes]